MLLVAPDGMKMESGSEEVGEMQPPGMRKFSGFLPKAGYVVCQWANFQILHFVLN